MCSSFNSLKRFVARLQQILTPARMPKSRPLDLRTRLGVEVLEGRELMNATIPGFSLSSGNLYNTALSQMQPIDTGVQNFTVVNNKVLDLHTNGALEYMNSNGLGEVTLDNNVQSFAVDPSNGIYALGASGNLCYAPAGGKFGTPIGRGVTSFQVGSDGSAWALNGSLYYYRYGKFAGNSVNGNWVASASNIVSFALDPSNGVYALDTSGNLRYAPEGGICGSAICTSTTSYRVGTDGSAWALNGSLYYFRYGKFAGSTVNGNWVASAGNIVSFALDPSNGVYVLDTAGNLRYAPAGGSFGSPICICTSAFQVGTDGSAWALNGSLYYFRYGKFAGSIVNGNWVASASNIVSFALDPSNGVYALDANKNLLYAPAGGAFGSPICIYTTAYQVGSDGSAWALNGSLYCFRYGKFAGNISNGNWVASTSNIVSFALDPSNGVYALDTNKNLLYAPAGGAFGSPLSTSTTCYQVGSDGSAWALNGSLYYFRYGKFAGSVSNGNWVASASNIVSFVLDPSNGVYALDTSGNLLYAPMGGGTLNTIRAAVTSFRVDSNGSAWVSASDGTLWHYFDGQFAGPYLGALGRMQWTVNQAGYSSSIAVSGGVGSYSGLVVSGLPQRITYAWSGSTITLSGIPTQTGTFTVTVLLHDSFQATASGTYSLTINPPPSLGSLSATQWTANQAGSLASVPIGGGTPGYSIVTAAGLPPGLSAAVSGNTIVLSGTPPQAGTFHIALTIRDAAGAQTSETYTLTVAPASALTLTPGALPAATAGQAYSVTFGATGGYGQYSFALAGNLPPGISLSSAGVLSGTSTVAGTYNFTITATDTVLSSLSTSHTCSLTVSPAAILVAISVPGSTTAGIRFTTSITAKDQYGNGYTGVVSLASSDGQAVSPSSISMTNGVASATVTLTVAHTVTLRATAGSVSGTSNSITVTPSAAYTVTTAVSSSTITVGQSVTLTVTVRDRYGNACTGMVSLTSSNSASLSPPAAVSLNSNGVATVTLTANHSSSTASVTLTATAGAVQGRASVTVSPSEYYWTITETVDYYYDDDYDDTTISWTQTIEAPNAGTAESQLDADFKTWLDDNGCDWFGLPGFQVDGWSAAN